VIAERQDLKHTLKDMTVAEFRDRLSPETVILLPFGSQEEQGPHAP
jgi:creatinine amidohydrolase